MKKLKYTLLILFCLVILFAPFINIGGNYYRGILGIWHKEQSTGTGNFIKLIPDFTYYSPIFFSDPTSFRFVEDGYAVDRFAVFHNGERVPNSDGNSFRSLGNGCFVDKYNARCDGSLILKRMSPELEPESFDSVSFQGNIFTRYEQEGNTDIYKKLDNYRTEAVVVKDNSGIYIRNERVVKTINGLELNIPVYNKLQNVDSEMFEARSVHSCQWDEKESKCRYVDICVLMDKDFIYETEPYFCKMTGVKSKR
jgi:DKNYY family